MCGLHDCVAEKIVIKTSRYKKGVGFMNENVSQLRCMGRIRGLESPIISTVHRPDNLPEPALCRNISGYKTSAVDQGLALEVQNNSDWRRDKHVIGSCNVIGRRKDSVSALTKLDYVLIRYHSVLF